ncbi:MAG: ribonuclease G [Gammaproteobacteria bacterium]|nr:MAG: ribonuclease G [Gammaproteobacteria bacterium]
MREEILINVTPQEIRVAVVENGMLTEMLVERSMKRGLVGNIYKGKVKRVLPGMQAAFIDIGLDRTAFLHASDIVRPKGENGCETEQIPISQLLEEGQTRLVQVVKDPLGTKGARLTTQLTIPSRYLVLVPEVPCLGISSKLEDETERGRLKTLVAELIEQPQTHGFIVRTAAESVGSEQLQTDIRYLHKSWETIRERAKEANDGSLVYEDLSLSLRTLRDLVDMEVDKVMVDSREAFRRMADFADRFLPEMRERIEHYPGERPLFDLYNIEDEIQKALQSKVQLKSGGHLVIDQTEAMTTIDVNTGAYVGHRNLEETIFKTNLEAAQAIARQLRLRNLGGIIIIDFIDMQNEEHKRQVLRAFEKCIDKDHAKCHITEISRLGLVEMTRKRTRESLEHILCESCPTCGGRGSVKTAQTVCYEIFREILREARQFDSDKLLVLASQEVVDLFLDEESDSVVELEEFIGKPIQFQAETLYSQENYDVVLM